MPCSYHLSSSKPSCIINRCNHSTLNNFVCFDMKKDDTCFLIDSTSTVDVIYQTEAAIFNGNSSYAFFATLLLLAVLISCLLIICRCCCLYRRDKSDSSRPESYDALSIESNDRTGIVPKKCICV